MRGDAPQQIHPLLINYQSLNIESFGGFHRRICGCAVTDGIFYGEPCLSVTVVHEQNVPFALGIGKCAVVYKESD